MHRPPFSHGELVHAKSKLLHLTPVKPGAQLHDHEFPCATQVPFRQGLLIQGFIWVWQSCPVYPVNF